MSLDRCDRLLVNDGKRNLLQPGRAEPVQEVRPAKCVDRGQRRRRQRRRRRRRLLSTELA